MTGEALLKKAVADCLQYAMNQGRCYADRLNSGKLLATYKGGQRMINLCREGTADFFVIMLKPRKVYTECRVIFLETKGEGGRQKPAQREFQKLVEAQGAEYHLIRDVDEVIALVS
jgi:hypothetical protein